MKLQHNNSWVYQVAVETKNDSQQLLSKFNSRVSDYNAIVLCVAEALIRMDGISHSSVLLTQLELEGNPKRIIISEKNHPALSAYLNNLAWGLKRKALSLVISESIKTIQGSEPDKLDSLIRMASCPWEELTEFTLPEDFSAASKAVKTEVVTDKEADKELEAELEALSNEVEPEIEADESLLADLAADFDMEMPDVFNTNVDEFKS